jgi:MYXO-CTERM domain-containing protein
MPPAAEPNTAPDPAPADQATQQQTTHTSSGCSAAPRGARAPFAALVGLALAGLAALRRRR